MGFRVCGLGFRVQGLGFRVEGLGFRVESLRFRSLGLGRGLRGFSRAGWLDSGQGLCIRVLRG